MEKVEIYTVAPACAEYPRNSEGTMLELNDGRLFLCWIEFPAKNNNPVTDISSARIVGAFSDDEGKSWHHKYVVLAPEAGQINVYSPCLVRISKNTILLAIITLYADHKHDGYIYMSSDEGKSFSLKGKIWEHLPYSFANSVLKKLTKLHRLVLPVSRRIGQLWSPEENNQISCFYSDDDGVTWTPPSQWLIIPLRGGMEPHIAELANGNLFMVIRTQLGYIYESISCDGGITWSEAKPSSLIAPESCPEVIRIPAANDLMVVWNNSPFLTQLDHSGHRSPLTVAISKDNGASWQNFKNIEDAPDGAFSNPGVYITSQKKVFINYWATKYIKRSSDRPMIPNPETISLKLAIFNLDYLYE